MRRPDERINSTLCPLIVAGFNSFIVNSGLVDFKMGGKRFKFFSEIRCKLSKLDRFLVCSKFTVAFLSASVLVLPREYSDHSTILLRTCCMDFGPPLFRFFNSWIQRDAFDGIVIQEMSSFSGGGSPERFMDDKFKFAKMQ